MTKLRIRTQEANCLRIQRIRIRAHNTANLHEEKNTYRGIFLVFFLLMYVIQHCFICRPSDSTVSEDAGIEPRTVTTLALTARRSNYLARSHPRKKIKK
jgi:hypothetical protein